MSYSSKVAVVIGGVVVLILLLAAGNTVLERWVVAAGRAEVVEIAEALASHVSGLLEEGGRALDAMPPAAANPCDAATRTALAEAEFDFPAVRRLAHVDAFGDALCAGLNGGQAVRRLSGLLSYRDGFVEAVGLTGSAFRGVRLWRAGESGRAATAIVGLGGIPASLVPAAIRSFGVVRLGLADGTPISALDHGRAGGFAPSVAEEPPLPSGGGWLTVTARRDGEPIMVELAMPIGFYLGEAEQTQTVLNLIGVVVGLTILGLVLKILMRPPSPAAELEAALRNDEFVPFYQPIVDLRRGALAGCEMLVRRRLPDGSLMPPAQFVPLAEATGLALPMTRALMERCAADLGPLYRLNPGLKVAINLFDEHFESLELAKDVQRIFDGSGIAFEQLVFEITERRPLQNMDRARVIIRRLQEIGAKVALDDAGTGHSGLAYLQQLGIDVLKIDKLFIDSITQEGSAAPIVDMLADLGRRMGMVVVAEGVENFDQIKYLRALGVDQAQGYAFAPPLPAASFRELVRQSMQAGSAAAAAPAEAAAVPAARAA